MTRRPRRRRGQQMTNAAEMHLDGTPGDTSSELHYESLARQNRTKRNETKQAMRDFFASFARFFASFAKFFASFAKFSRVVRSFWTCSGLLRRVRMDSDAFGCLCQPYRHVWRLVRVVRIIRAPRMRKTNGNGNGNAHANFDSYFLVTFSK